MTGLAKHLSHAGDPPYIWSCRCTCPLRVQTGCAPSGPDTASPEWVRCLARPVMMRYELVRRFQLELASIFAELQVCTGRCVVEGCVGASHGSSSQALATKHQPRLDGPLCQGLMPRYRDISCDQQWTSFAPSKAASSADSKARTGCAL